MALNSVSRAAMAISSDENFDEIYKKRFQKYCRLLTKEKELLHRMSSHQIQSLEGNENGDVNSKKLNYLIPRSRRTSDGTLNNSRIIHLDSKNLSTSCEILAIKPEERSAFMKRSSSEEILSLNFQKSSTGFLQNFHTQQNLNAAPKERSVSAINSSYYKKEPVITLLNDHADGQDFEQQRSFQEHSYKDVTKIHRTQSYEQLLEGTKTMSLDNSRQLEFKSNGLRKSYYNTLVTSSQRNLQEQNIRSNVEKQRVRCITPKSEKRLADANSKSAKRAEVLRKLDEDFSKANRLIKVFKSTEAINT
ncbi:uncharacterized protein LOC100214519 [Hydra vulgaris]|uniref:uncharacterized protein LOC100214519 n=1 Tax=Hydra vulgaris TaxID=6087 RepID=UPI00019259EF|nr:uncharacterized protein LOC100214519 [Hydra vulgaris]